MSWRVFNPDLEIDHQRISTTSKGLAASGAIIRAAASRRLWCRDFDDICGPRHHEIAFTTPARRNPDIGWRF